MTIILVINKMMCYNEIVKINKEASMEVFGMIGFPLAIFAFIIAITNQNKCSKLEKQLKKLKRKTKGDTSMSRLIKNLVVQKAFVITADEASVEWEVLDADEEWIYLSRSDKKGNIIEKYVPFDEIKAIRRQIMAEK